MGIQKFKSVKLKHFYYLPITKELTPLYNDTFNEMMTFAKSKGLDGLDDDLETLCDLYFATKVGVLKCHFIDYIPDCEGEGILLSIKQE